MAPVRDDERDNFVGFALFAVYSKDGIHEPDYTRGLTGVGQECPKCHYLALFNTAPSQARSGEAQS